MSQRMISVELPRDRASQAQKVAALRGMSLPDLVAQALDRELRRAAPAKTPRRADERLLAPLRTLLAADLAEATGWDDLARRLTGRGYALRPRGGGLALYDLRTGDRLCKASELGYRYADLVRRFGAPMPGHPHAHLARRILGTGHPAAPPVPDDDADFDVIERF